MKYALIINGIVKQTQPNMQDGFIKVADNIVCGMIGNEDGTFSIPQKSQEQIDVEKQHELDLFLSALTVQAVGGFKFSADPKSLVNISLEIDTMLDNDTRTWYEDWGSQVVTKQDLQEAKRLASEAKQAKLTELFVV